MEEPAQRIGASPSYTRVSVKGKGKGLVNLDGGRTPTYSKGQSGSSAPVLEELVLDSPLQHSPGGLEVWQTFPVQRFPVPVPSQIMS